MARNLGEHGEEVFDAVASSAGGALASAWGEARQQFVKAAREGGVLKEKGLGFTAPLQAFATNVATSCSGVQRKLVAFITEKKGGACWFAGLKNGS